MAAVAHDPAFAKKVGIKQSVGKEFASADKGKTFKRGGDVANTSRMNKLEELGRVDSEKASTSKGKKNLMAEKKRIVGEMKYAKGGSVGVGKMGGVRTAAPSRDGIAAKGKTKGKQIVMKSSPGTMRGGSRGK